MSHRHPGIPFRPLAAALVVTAATLIAAACGGGDGGGNGGGNGGGDASPTAGNRPPAAVTVVTTLPVFADFIRESGGDRVEVIVVLPQGIDRDVVELPPELIERIGEGDVVLYNGLDLEAAVEDLLFEHKRRGSLIVAYSNDVPSPTSEGATAWEARDNRYLWLDPVLARTYVDTTWDSLVIVDGEAANTYRTNGERYRGEIDAVHEQLQQSAESIPPENRKLVAFRDSFFHLANRYGLEPVRLPTPVSTDEPSPRRVENLATLIAEQGVPAVFVEPGFESDLLTQAARRAGVEVCTLYSDSLDEQVTTYIEMITFNGQELARCLGGE